MTGKHGGARPGAGRKSKAEKYETEINAAERYIADRLPQFVKALEELALLGTETVHETWEPAGMITIDDVILDDASGKEQKVKRLAFPHKKADEMVLVQRRVVRGGPSESAVVYGIDRILGKPTAEVEVSGPDGGPLETVTMTMEEWKQRAAERLAQANATYALLDEEGEGDAA